MSGLVLVLIAQTAHMTGLDPENNWGAARRQVLLVGLIALGVALAGWLWPSLARATSRVRARLAHLARLAVQSRWLAPIARGLTRRTIRLRQAVEVSRPGRWARARPQRPALLAAGAVFCLAIPIAVWFVSVGFWTTWPPTNHYYSDLADAFSSGQLYLLESPDPALLALPDPYEYEQRKHIDAPWDVVLYDGRFYLYWGPVPALMLVGWRGPSAGVVGDNVLVFGFVLGIALFTLLALAEVWTSRYRALTVWALVPLLLAAAFAHPLPWLLNRPAVYEASIAAAQCFFMAGVYLALPLFLKGRIGNLRLFLSGVSWALAVGSKASLSLAVALWACAAVILALKSSDAWRRKAAQATALGLPLLLGLAALLMYNQARFGNPFEFGVRYQLTGLNVNRDVATVFSGRNVPVNLYNYLFTPVTRLSVFPYIKPQWSSSTFPLLSWLTRQFPGLRPWQSEIYYPEQVTGLIYVLPLGVFGLAAWVLADRRRRPDPVAGHTPGTDDPPSGRIGALVGTLTAGAILAGVPSLTAGFATMRYMAEVVPSLVVLSAVGAWEWLADRRRSGAGGGWLLILIWAAALASVGASLLLAVTGYDRRFELLNPVLFDRIVRFLAP